MSKTNYLLGLCLAMTIGSMTACSDDDHYDQIVDQDKRGIQLRSTQEFGSVLTDKEGKTLYFFSPDVNGAANCNGQCAVTWPAYYDEQATSNKDIDAKDIGVITRADGKKQNTYKGWPLYYFSGDTNTTDIKGDGVNGTWFVAKPDYILMVGSTQLIGADGNKYKEDLTEGEGVTTYFTNGAGRTVYVFTPDKFNTNTFTKEDFSNDAVWPIYQTDVGAVPSVIKKELLVTINVFGKKQITYKGRPLYYFGQDAKRGETKGISVPRPGVWPYVNLKTTEAPRN